MLQASKGLAFWRWFRMMASLHELETDSFSPQ